MRSFCEQSIVLVRPQNRAPKRQSKLVGDLQYLYDLGLAPFPSSWSERTNFTQQTQRERHLKVFGCCCDQGMAIEQRATPSAFATEGFSRLGLRTRR